MEQTKVSFKEKLGYGGFFFGQNIYYGIVGSFLLIFYTEVIGISALSVGLMFSIARLWDAINDPLIGIAVDKFHIKNKNNYRFMPWIKVSTYLLPIIVILLFTNPVAGADDLVKLIYAYVTYIAFGMIYTLSDVPIFAQSTVVSSDINERTSYLMFGRLFAMFGGLIAIVIFPLLMDSLGISVAAYIVAIIAFFLTLPFTFTGKERIRPVENPVTLTQMVKFVFTNKYLLIYFLTFFILRGFAVGSLSSNYLYLYVVGNASIVSLTGLISIIPGILLAIFAPLLIKKFGKRNIYIILHVISIISAVLFYLLGYDSLLIILVFTLGSGLAVIASSIFMGLFVGDCIEYSEFKTGHRNEALSFSVQTFTNKAATAVTSLLGGIILTIIGYTDAENISSETAQGLFTMTTIIPAIGVLISIIVFIIFYRLNETRVNELIKHNREKNEQA